MRSKRNHPVLRTLFLIAVSLVFGLNLYSWNARNLTGDALPMPFGFGMATVLSGSMEPALSVGDLLIVQAQDSYEVGDMVVYQNGRMPVVHRIVDITDGTVTTRGDANNVNDQSFSAAFVKGKVIYAIPFLGRVIWMLKKPVVIVALLVAAVLLFERSFRAVKEEKEQEKELIKAQIRALMEELKEDNPSQNP